MSGHSKFANIKHKKEKNDAEERKEKIKKGLLCFETLLHILHENGQSHYYC